MQNGIIYSAIDTFLNTLRYLNLVELFKFLAGKFTPEKAPLKNRIRNLRISVDIFILLKWVLFLILIRWGEAHPWATAVSWYLLVSNLYTYFYLHSWSSDILKDPFMDTDRIKRRFLNLLLAILFTIFVFAYLYAIPYSQHFDWGNGSPNMLNSFWYSVSNSLTANYGQVSPSTDLGNSMSMIQLLFMFAFLTIIIGGSVPQITYTQEGKDGLQK